MGSLTPRKARQAESCKERGPPRTFLRRLSATWRVDPRLGRTNSSVS